MGTGRRERPRTDVDRSAAVGQQEHPLPSRECAGVNRAREGCPCAGGQLRASQRRGRVFAGGGYTGMCMVPSSTQDWGRASRHSASCRPTPRVRYTVLTGAPPFTVAPLSEMYRNIRDGRYPEPAHLSASARRLIARLLAPNAAERPSLDQLLQDDFFTQVRAAQRGDPPWGAGLGRGRPRCVLTPGAPPRRASLQTGCRPTLATARPSSPCPSLWADSSGRWASCCGPSARRPVSNPPAPASPLASHTCPASRLFCNVASVAQVDVGGGCLPAAWGQALPPETPCASLRPPHSQ